MLVVEALVAVVEVLVVEGQGLERVGTVDGSPAIEHQSGMVPEVGANTLDICCFFSLVRQAREPTVEKNVSVRCAGECLIGIE